MQIVQRAISLDLPRGASAFLRGPRRVGKSYWLRQAFPKAPLIDLLETDVFAEYASRPALLREVFADGQAAKQPIIIDEIQKVPALLDEVHWLIERRKQSFILSGSSARKLKRDHANLLAGRAWRRTMTPLCTAEVKGFDLARALRWGLLPPHVLSAHPDEDLRAYVADYLREEIAAEALTRNLPAFAEFLRVAAQTNGELLNYANVARECGVSAKVVRGFFEILENTYLGTTLAPWTRSRNRRMIETAKFYFFDVGVANQLARRAPVPGSLEYGKAFEHFIYMELRAYQAYRAPDSELRYWRTSTGREVDFVVNDLELAVEVKSGTRVHEADLRGLLALLDDAKVRRAIVVCDERAPRKVGAIEIMPWKHFTSALWAGDLIA